MFIRPETVADLALLETATMVKVGFEDGEECTDLTFFMKIRMRCGADR